MEGNTERNSSLMESSMEISMEGSIMKMSTSESEQSLSEKSVSRSSDGTNRSIFFFEHLSDDDAIREEDSEDCSINGYSELRNKLENSDIRSHGSLGSLEEFLDDSRNHNVSFEKSNYFSLTFVNDDIETLTTAKHDMEACGEPFATGEYLNSTVNGGEDESDEEDQTLLCNTTSDINMKKNSLKLFSPEKVIDAMSRMRPCNNCEEKLSPMDLSSPDSQNSFTEAVTKSLTQSLGTFTLSEESPTFTGTQQQDSLDEISSGEMSSDSGGNSSHISQNVLEFWDEEERYLSEKQYDEQIDVDKERQLMSFGDDYRNFLDSLSESHSSLGGYLMDDRRKKSKRLSKKKLPDSARSYDTCSDNDMDDVSSMIADSQRSINSVETKRNDWEEDGFVRETHFQEYNELVGICSENLKAVVDVLRTKDLQETFVSKKKSREMRFLLNKWERLHNKIKANIQHTGVYSALKTDVMAFKKDLTQLLEKTEDSGHTEEKELGNRLHTFKEAMIELSDFKSHLFELNLSVHNFLAELNSCEAASKAKFQHAAHLKEDVISLYTLWDRAHHQTAGSIASTEEALNKLKCFETELLGLRDSLRHDVRLLKEKGNRKRIGNKSKSSSGDSGISDDSMGYFTDGDLPLREEHLTKLRIMAKSLEQNLPPSSTPMMMINHTLKSTSDELKDLQKTYSKFKALKRKPKSINAVKGKECVTRITNYETLRRRQVVRMALLMNGLLLFTAFLCWICQPSCCEQHNTMTFQPQLRYVNGPPPT